jgi:hypothetical protein
MAAYDFQPAGTATPVLVNNSTLVKTTVALGRVMQEARFQVTGEHKTRVRLWVSDDPAVGGRLEIANRIGVLEQKTNVLSRFTAAELSRATFYSEDNGYETVKHASGCQNCTDDPTRIPYRYFPSQMSTFLSDGRDQLSIALAHSHAVGSLANGTLDIMQHRRGHALTGVDGNLALDDADRIFSETWISIGNVSASNRLRHGNKLRLNHPLAVMFGLPSPGSDPAGLRDRFGRHESSSALSAVPSVPAQIHMQTIRATNVSAKELMLNAMHLFGKSELPVEDSAPIDINLAAILEAFRPDVAANVHETTLNGMLPKKDLNRHHWKTIKVGTDRGTEVGDGRRRPVDGEQGVLKLDALTMVPFNLRTFLASSTPQTGS